jgi:hypothetical protein
MAGFINQIRSTLGNFLLNRRFIKNMRNKELVSLNLAENLGIIFHVKNQEQFSRFNALAKELSTNRRKVLLVGFINDKTIPDYCVVAGPGYYFCRQDLNWLNIPKNDYILKFIEKEFDILLDFTRDDSFTMKYILALSKARLKAGQQSDIKEPFLDVMIQMDNSQSMNQFIEQILHYLTLLKSRQNG